MISPYYSHWIISLKFCIIAPRFWLNMSFMDYSKLIETLTPDMIERFTSAVETGKWPDGSKLSDQQKETCLQAIMLYQAKHNDAVDEPFTVTKDGQLVTGQKLRNDYSSTSLIEEKQQGSVKIDPALIIPNKNKH